jgi:phosphoribosylanthranilate isomerase
MKLKNIKIKICGLKTISEVKCASDYGAFWYGMIFVKNSPRYINYKRAEVLITNTPKSLKPIAVTVNPSYSLIKFLTQLGIKDIQLHGNETVNFCLRIKKEYNLNIIKAISINSLGDIKLAHVYKKVAEWILFDYKDEIVMGGSGKSFDWNLLSDKKFNFNWILSGGLDYNNIKDALKITGAKAVDVSSGVEVEKGIKSTEMIKNFCEMVNNT